MRLSRLVEQLTVELGRSPTIPELATEAGVGEEAVVDALESGRAYSLLSLSQAPAADGGEELDPLETLGEIEREYEAAEDRAALAPGFRALDPRERRILHLRFFGGLTQSQIARQVGVSQMHVSRLLVRALVKLHDELGAEELASEPERPR
jgi:RNA polymerase sigma-B factor